VAVAITDTSDLAPKTRIVATTNLPGVPEGTAGKVGRSVGLTLTRYRVAFDNGIDITSVTHTKLVKEDEWDDYRERREAGEAEDQAGDGAGAPAEAADPQSEAAAPAAGDDRLAALLAKSKAAKAKKLGTEPAADAEPAAAADPQPEAAAPAAGDDRLAALLAKSKAAKAAKLAEG